MSDAWRVLQSRIFCDTPYLTLAQELITTPSRPDGVRWMVAHRPAAVVVAPRTPDGRFLLIRQERAAIRQITWEFPAGQIDGEVSEAAIRETALRELGEETGMRCDGELISLGFFYSSVGFTDEHCHLFLATDVVPRPEGVDHDENEAILETRAFSKDELQAMLASCEIFDANSLAVYSRLVLRQLL